MDIKKISKFLSLILRHKPETIGIKLDKNGWANVSEILRGMKIDMATLEKVVAENNKQRFSFSADKTKIRANQGHSVKVDVEMTEKIPPEILYHGTIEKNLKSIAAQGILKMNRLHVHLSADIETAKNVAARRTGNAVIYKIFAQKMYNDGYKFFQSANGVWLTDKVPLKYFETL
jgi:putative RNA 2'-phosphotransferase